MKRTIKAQSAMEYLMTYGWGVLVILIVLAALFYSGIFSANSAISDACIAVSGFHCGNPSLSISGTMSFTLEQELGYNIFNIELACQARGNDGLPETSNTWEIVASNGLAQSLFNVPSASANAQITTNTVAAVDDSLFQVTGLQCYDQYGNPVVPPTIGTSYTGYIWINYTEKACTVTPCTWLTAELASLSLKST